MNEHNDLFEQIQLAITRHSKTLIKATETVFNEGVSNYPIIIAIPEGQQIEIGLPLQLQDSDYSYNISTLEELFVKNIVNREKVDNFRAVYNHKPNHLCVLLIIEQKAEFLFVPYTR